MEEKFILVKIMVLMSESNYKLEVNYKLRSALILPIGFTYEYHNLGIFYWRTELFN